MHNGVSSILHERRKDLAQLADIAIDHLELTIRPRRVSGCRESDKPFAGPCVVKDFLSEVGWRRGLWHESIPNKV
jgi:hypothetical protein